MFFPSHNYIFTSLINPLTENTVEQRKYDLEKQRGMHRGGKIFIGRVLFRLITSKGLQKPLKIGHKDPAEPNLFIPSLKGIRAFTIISGWKKKKKDKGQRTSSDHPLLVI